MKFLKGAANARQRLAALFVDREFFMRANGDVRFVRISALLQRRIATGLVTLILLWIVLTIGMAFNQWSVSLERNALARSQARVATAAERVSAYRASVGDVADDLKQRQDLLDELYRDHFGAAPSAAAAKPDGDAEATARKIGAAVPEARALASVEARQIAFATALTSVARTRAAKAERAIRTFGLDPANLARAGNAGLGGPFVPFFGKGRTGPSDPRFSTLADALDHMGVMERMLAAIPSSMPATVPALTSSYGYRRDPFTGAAAMHAGLDFRGPYGSPILAAADGIVSFVGQRQGYGNCVEISHGGGIVTRYAHLSGFVARAGQKVTRGAQIARMGSTGRSTGTHLHFEVRVNGAAVNPSKFLGNHNVFETAT